jgi:hypothetical protein
MTPIKKLHSFFATKKQFEGEIAMNGLRFDDKLKKVFKDLDEKGEIDKSVIKNYKFICCEQFFKREIKYLLEGIELDVFNKTNVIAPNDLKCDYIEIQIKEIIDLAIKTESLIKEYSEINLENLDVRFNMLFSMLINLNDKSTIDIKTSDDLIDDIISCGKILNSISVSNNDLVKLFDFNYSDIYVTCLIEITNEIISTISRIVETSEYILDVKFKVIKSPPFLILREQPQTLSKKKSKKETPKTFDEFFYNRDLVNPCIDVLKELTSPFIDADFNYIGKLKGVYCLWIDELIKQGIIKRYTDRKIYASLLPTKLKGFSIDESMFGKFHIRAEKKYLTDIKTKVSIIKLSQVSQKEN